MLKDYKSYIGLFVRFINKWDCQYDHQKASMTMGVIHMMEQLAQMPLSGLSLSFKQRLVLLF